VNIEVDDIPHVQSGKVDAAATLAPAPTTEQTDAITTFADALIPVVQEIVAPENTYLLGRNPYPPISNTTVLREHRFDVEFAYSDSPGALLASRQYPGDLRDYQNLIDKFTFNSYVRLAVRVSFRCVPSPSSYGGLLVAWAPNYRISNDTAALNLGTNPTSTFNPLVLAPLRAHGDRHHHVEHHRVRDTIHRPAKLPPSCRGFDPCRSGVLCCGLVGDARAR